VEILAGGVRTGDHKGIRFPSPGPRRIPNRFYGLDKYSRFREAAHHASDTGLTLDVGGGTGDFFDFIGATGILAEVAPDRSLFGRVKPHYQVVIFDGEHLPFRDRAFGTVFCLDTLEHVSGDVRPLLLSELLRVASESVVITFPERHFLLPLLVATADFYSRLGVGSIMKKSLDEHMKYGLPVWDRLAGTINPEVWSVSVRRFFGPLASVLWMFQLALPFLATVPFNLAFSRFSHAQGNRNGSEVIVVARRKTGRQGNGRAADPSESHEPNPFLESESTPAEEVNLRTRRSSS
jgi:hypothetical protein